MVSQVADEVLVMYGGRAVEHGSVEQVLRRPQHPYTWGLLSSVPSLHGDADADLVPIPGNPPSLINLPPGCAFHPRCRYADRNGDRSRTEVPELRPAGDARPPGRLPPAADERTRLYAEDIAQGEWPGERTHAAPTDVPQSRADGGTERERR